MRCHWVRLRGLVPLVLLALAGCGPTGPRSHEAIAKAPRREAPARAPIVMFLGDSYTLGGPAIKPEATYAANTARTLGWQVVIGGAGGTGFVAPGSSHTPFRVMFDRQLGWRPAPDMVIVSGGHNDAKYAPSRVAAAATSLLSEIRRLWPAARLVVIGPMWGSGAPDPSAVEIRDALKTTARDLAIPFIDPLAEQWITGDRRGGVGNAPRYIQRDDIHPTAAGHQYLATRLVADLRRLGLDLRQT